MSDAKKKKFKKDDIIGEIIDRRIKKHQSNREILEWLQGSNKYRKQGYSHTQAYKYLNMSRDLITEQYDQTSEQSVSDAIAKYEEMMGNMVKKENFKLWNDMFKELNRLKGLYKEKIEIDSTGIVFNFVSPKKDDNRGNNEENED
jgi:hypothetical protein